jgi:hypothetical protein
MKKKKRATPQRRRFDRLPIADLCEHNVHIVYCPQVSISCSDFGDGAVLSRVQTYLHDRAMRDFSRVYV